MRIVLQRVQNASVSVDDKRVASIEKGLVLLLGVQHGDSLQDAEYLAHKCANLRIFEDKDGKLNLSALEVGAHCLVVSQFTLYGDCKKGRRPSFTDAAPPEISENLYLAFTEKLRGTGLGVEMGVFGAKMLVEINNDGPVTLIIDSPPHLNEDQ
jgi:D-tyrosyl-tRNA(Tyr) deacylase